MIPSIRKPFDQARAWVSGFASTAAVLAITSCAPLPSDVQQSVNAVNATTVTTVGGVSTISLPAQPTEYASTAIPGRIVSQEAYEGGVVQPTALSPIGRGAVGSSDAWRLFELRQQAAASNRDHDPARRPSSLPREFSKVAWRNEIPVFPSGASAKLASDFGWRALKGRKDFHGGIDMVVKPGQKVQAVRGGTVVWVNRSGYWGGVVVSTGDRLYTYWHSYPLRNLTVGSRVQAGEVIAQVADAGDATHLHYAIHLVSGGDWRARSDHNAIDPLMLVQTAGIL